MEREILAYIKQNRMIGKNDVVLAGVSGGSDSMAMLRILKELQGKLDFTLRVVHIHHGIRGKEADRDQSFVENICRKWQIPCTVYCYDVPGLSREWKLGEEETGRIVRKEAFQREAAVCGRKDSEIKIALAHNQEDLAETMLHNLCRGTGLRGLCTMRPVDGEIIRPILCLNRDKIAEYLKEKKISHIQDSTNLSDEYTRNRIRHHILPMLEQQVNGKAAAHMALTHKKQVVKFDDCGLFRLLYMVKDKEILKEMETECLAALEEYDRRYHAGYVETLQSYLKHNGSIQAVAAELYTHRNTVLYRIGNIRKILGNELKTPEERLPYQIAFYIRNMQ